MYFPAIKHKIIDNSQIEYKLRKSRRAKRARITINCDGAVLVTIPRGISVDFAKRFVEEKKKWILEKLKVVKGRSGERLLAKRNGLEYMRRAAEARKDGSR